MFRTPPKYRFKKLIPPSPDRLKKYTQEHTKSGSLYYKEVQVPWRKRQRNNEIRSANPDECESVELN